MRQSFLDNLVGMSVEDARAAVNEAGLHAYVRVPGVDPCLDGHSLVILRGRNGVVVQACAGIESEVEHD